MGAVVEIWFESLIPFLLKDSHIVHCGLSIISNMEFLFSWVTNLYILYRPIRKYTYQIIIITILTRHWGWAGAAAKYPTFP